MSTAILTMPPALTRTAVFSFSLLAATALTPLASAQETRAQTRVGFDGTVSKSEVSSGALLIGTSQPGRYVKAPLVAGEVHMDISGPIIRTRLTQRFTNPTDKWVEGVYAFPLPEDAAVDSLRVILGDKFIEGDIKERKEARIIYEQAAANGQRAGLVEEERPNLFTTSLANIGPGETVAVQIEFQDKARLDKGVWSTRFPMVIAPRYSPAPKIGAVADRDGRTVSITDPVPDRDRITPPVLHPAQETSGAEGLRLPVSFDIAIKAGVNLKSVSSQSHELVLTKPDANTTHVTLKDGDVPADRDFVLNWTPEPLKAPKASLFKESRDGQDYFFAVVTPPDATQVKAQRRDRETIFVIDNSGSMSGESMDQAKAGLLLGLDRLMPTDEFNVIRFDDTMDQLFPNAVPANAQNLARAKRFVSNLQANGGTEMLPALKAALVDRDTSKKDEVRQVVFITDGSIGNEDELFKAIHDGLGRSRLFTVGIGSAPNSFFMTRAARQGRGTFTYMDDVSKVREQSAKLFAALENPVMTDLALSLPPGASDVFPSPLPDLYAGEPVTVLLKGQATGAVTLTGNLDGNKWSQTLSLADAQAATGVTQLWARAKIAGIEESRFTGVSDEVVDQGVLKTALDFHLVSRLTSLVAVDKTPARPAGEKLDTRQIATMLPKGWDFRAVFGPRAEARALRVDRLPDNVLEKIAARAPPKGQGGDDSKDEELNLPQTANNWLMSLVMGFALIGIGAAALDRRRILFIRLRGQGSKEPVGGKGHASSRDRAA